MKHSCQNVDDIVFLMPLLDLYRNPYLFWTIAEMETTPVVTEAVRGGADSIELLGSQ